MNVQTGWEMYGVEKQREGICPGWKNDGRENVRGGQMTGGNMSWWKNNWREYVLDVKNDRREYVREGICLWFEFLCLLFCFIVVQLVVGFFYFFVQNKLFIMKFAIPFAMLIHFVYFKYCKICDEL